MLDQVSSQVNPLTLHPRRQKNTSHHPSSSTARPVTARPSSNNKSKAMSIPNGHNGKASTADMTQVQANEAAMPIKSAASAAIVKAGVQHGHPNGNGSLARTDRNKFVRKVLTLIDVRLSISLFLSGAFHSFPVVRFDRLMSHSWIGFGRSIVRGRSISSQLCMLIAWLSFCDRPSLILSPPFHLARCVSPRCQYRCTRLRCTHTCTEMY